jgi:hypothetical protein
LRELIVQIARKIEPFLLLAIDELGGELGLFADCPVKARRERVEHLADALQLDQPEVRQAT